MELSRTRSEPGLGEGRPGGTGFMRSTGLASLRRPRTMNSVPENAQAAHDSRSECSNSPKKLWCVTVASGAMIIFEEEKYKTVPAIPPRSSFAADRWGAHQGPKTFPMREYFLPDQKCFTRQPGGGVWPASPQ